MRRAFLALLTCALAAVASAPPAAAALCAIDPVPGATLLYPFFEVDLQAPATHNTVLAMENVGDSAVIAHVTFWTDWAIPVLAFDVYLPPFDVQTLDLREVLVDGRLPATGKAVSPHGPLSGPPVTFPGCNHGSVPGPGPVYPDPALDAFTRAQLQAALTGLFSPPHNGCVGANRGDSIARGYVTVDANSRCSLLFPSSAGYFAPTGPASRRNVLVGDLTLLRPDEGHATAFAAVALEAAGEGEQVPGGRTFYRRYVAGGEDGREPLPTTFEARVYDGGVLNAGTTYFVWRETATGAPGPVQCGNTPSWEPLSTEPLAFFDELENVIDVSQDFPVAVDVQEAENPFSFGRAVLDLQHPGVTAAQAWVVWMAKTAPPANPLAASVPAAHHPISCGP